MLGLAATLQGTFHPMMLPEDQDPDKQSPEEIDWGQAITARSMLETLRQDESLAAAVTLHFELNDLVGLLGGNMHASDRVLERFGVAVHLVEIFDPIGRRLPGPQKAFWCRVKRQATWVTDVWSYMEHSIESESAGPLVEVARSLPDATRARMRVRPPAKVDSALPRPSMEVVRKVRTALEELIRGSGSVTTRLQSWSVGEPQGKPAEAVVELDMLGLHTTVRGKICPFTPDVLFGPDHELSVEDIQADEEWQIAATARLVLDELVSDQALAVNAITSQAILVLLEEGLGYNKAMSELVHARLGLSTDLEVLLDPIAQRLPADAKADWYYEKYLPEHIGSPLAHAIQIECEGPLQDFVDACDDSVLERLPLPPPETSHSAVH